MKRRIIYLSFIAILSFCFLLSGCNSAISISALNIGGSEISKDAFLAEIAEREAYNDRQFISEQWYRVKMQTLSDKESSDNKNSDNSYLSISGNVMLSSLQFRSKFRFSVNSESFNSQDDGTEITKNKLSGQVTCVDGEIYTKLKNTDYQKNSGGIKKSDNVTYFCDTLTDNSDINDIIELIKNFDVAALLDGYIDSYRFETMSFFRVPDGYAFSLSGADKVQLVVTYMEGSSRVKTLSLYLFTDKSSDSLASSTSTKLEISASTSRRISAPSNKDKYKMR
jgi:hypothetical protein